MVEKLLETYEKINDKKFEISDMDSKKEMQKAIFILSLSGMTFENYYGYVWDEYGPYSSELAEDLKIYCSTDVKIKCDFNDKELDLINKFRKMLSEFAEGKQYDVVNVVEAKASMMFFKEIDINLTNEEILSKLLTKNPHLKYNDINKKILQFNF